MTNRKYFGYSPTKKLSRGSSQEFLRGWADHDRARIARKKQQSIFQASHHGVHVFTHGAEDFVHAAELLANLRNLAADLAEFVAASRESPDLRHGRVVLPGGYAVQLRGDPRQGRQRRPAHHRG